MAENLIYSRLRGEEQEVFINTGKILGVQNISIEPNLSISTKNHIGIGGAKIYPFFDGEKTTSATINALLVNRDNFIELTGKHLINIFTTSYRPNIRQNNYSLISGCMTSYNCKYTVNQIPEISASFLFFRNSGPLSNILDLSLAPQTQILQVQNNNYSSFDSGILIPYGGSMDLTLNEYNTNRVLEFNIQINANRIPIYNIGQANPVKIQTIYPLEINCSFTFESTKMFSGVKLKPIAVMPTDNQNISLQLNSYSGNIPIANYAFNNMTLISETTQISENENNTITRNYIGYIYG